jgi:hypothetical protein
MFLSQDPALVEKFVLIRESSKKVMANPLFLVKLQDLLPKMKRIPNF